VLEHLTELDWAMRQGQQLRTPADVAAAAHWPGDVELFAASLVRLGYLARSADGRYLTTVAWPSVDPRFYNWLFDARLFDPDGLDDRRRTED
jgi:hypothetical protein